MASLEFGNVMRRSAPLRMTMEKVVRIYCWRTRCFDCSAPAALRTGFGEVAGWAAHRPPIQPPHPKKNESRSDEQSKKRVRQQYRSFVRTYDKHTKMGETGYSCSPEIINSLRNLHYRFHPTLLLILTLRMGGTQFGSEGLLALTHYNEVKYLG